MLWITSAEAGFYLPGCCAGRVIDRETHGDWRSEAQEAEPELFGTEHSDMIHAAERQTLLKISSWARESVCALINMQEAREEASKSNKSEGSNVNMCGRTPEPSEASSCSGFVSQSDMLTSFLSGPQKTHNKSQQHVNARTHTPYICNSKPNPSEAG